MKFFIKYITKTGGIIVKEIEANSKEEAIDSIQEDCQELLWCLPSMEEEFI